MRSKLSGKLAQAFLEARRGVHSARLIVGSGRSGTTWLQTMACRAAALRPVFEPFHAEREPAFSDVPFGRYIRPRAAEPDLQERVEAVLSGRFRSEWQDHLCRPGVYRGRVVKEIRNLLWAGWLCRNFPQVPTVYVIRHPMAVASSSRALEWQPEHFQRMLGESELFRDHLPQFGPEVSRLRTPWERALAGWCIENIVAIRTLPDSGAQLLIYEDALVSAEVLRSFLEHLRVPTGNLEGADAPSVTTRPDSPVLMGDRTATSWTSTVNGRLLEEGMEVLRMFRFDRFFAMDGTVDSARLHSAWAGADCPW